MQKKALSVWTHHDLDSHDIKCIILESAVSAKLFWNTSYIWQIWLFFIISFKSQPHSDTLSNISWLTSIKWPYHSGVVFQQLHVLFNAQNIWMRWKIQPHATYLFLTSPVYIEPQISHHCACRCLSSAWPSAGWVMTTKLDYVFVLVLWLLIPFMKHYLSKWCDSNWLTGS